ncbi:centrosomal protein of 95 kDa isoform X2 [Ranitomeya variabilis]|uniref:centrosomal protein of 95 kDa isoform X2 n=1 Tax=Ranitomeya variabilis TaxID=490064 RepID=UPI004056FB75
MGSVESDWVAIANSLLYRCRLSLPVAELTHCDAHVFVALYEAILGEPVPDLIADSRTAEDDAHNVQSVIDSLALDYLQVSLSHITGENVVLGDTESIKNLLEIFDGLLEYLTEQISEASSQNGEDAYPLLRGQLAEFGGDGKILPPSFGSLSSDLHPPSWGADGSESTAELIHLGDTAHTFTLRGLDLVTLRKEVERPQTPRPPAADRHLSAVTGGNRSLKLNGHSLEEQESATRPGPPEPPTAVLLKRPCQQDRPPAEDRDVLVSLSSAGSSLSGPAKSMDRPDGRRGPAAPGHGDIHEKSEGAEQRKSPATRREEAREVDGAARRIEEVQRSGCLRSAPDIHLVTLQSDGTLSREGHIQSGATRPPEDPEHSLLISPTPDPLSLADEPLSVQRVRNRVSELELQQMSEKLSRRLDELDQMLRKALGGPSGSGGEMKEDDKLSQHSDSIMEIRRKKRLHAPRHVQTPGARPRSLSSSPLPPPRRSVSAQFEDALNKDGRGEMGKIRRGVQKELDLERLKARRLRRAYEEELKDFQETEKQKLGKLKAALRAEEQEYKENLQDPPRSHPERVYGGKREPPRRWTPSLQKPAGPVTVAENNLLPLLLEEFPHLQISPHALGAMWRGQLAQVEQLARSVQEDERSERQLQKEVQEAHRKQELLVGLVQREQEHNQRLKDFKDRIRLQKSAQNRQRENRQQVARAKRYYDDYHVQLRAKLLRARTREERMFQQLFAEGLELQKRRLREVRSYAKEQREEQRRRHQDELESMENYYKDQFSMMADAVSRERRQLQSREKAQSKNVQQMKRELRVKMEKEIQDLQEMILRTDEDAFFRELEAERLQRRLHMAAFQYSKSHGL